MSVLEKKKDAAADFDEENAAGLTSGAKTRESLLGQAFWDLVKRASVRPSVRRQVVATLVSVRADAGFYSRDDGCCEEVARGVSVSVACAPDSRGRGASLGCEKEDTCVFFLHKVFIYEKETQNVFGGNTCALLFFFSAAWRWSAAQAGASIELRAASAQVFGETRRRPREISGVFRF